MTKSPVIVVTNPIFAETRMRLAALGEVVCNPGPEPWSREALLEHAQGADALMAFMTDCVDDAFLSQCPSLKIVAGALKGYDNLDGDACAARGVWLTIVPDLLTAPTAELAVALTLGLNRHVMAGDARVRGGGFAGWRAEFYGLGLHGAEVGIAGLGRVGLETVRRLQGFGCRLSGFDLRPPGQEVLDALHISLLDRDALLAGSDVLILALPLNARTLHWIDAGALEKLKPGARLVNIGRGSVVDEEAIAAALKAERLGGYAADVFEFEDWARGDRPPEVAQALLEWPDRTLFTPHLGSAVTSVRRSIEMAAVENIEAALAGKLPPDAVNRPEGVL